MSGFHKRQQYAAELHNRQDYMLSHTLPERERHRRVVPGRGGSHPKLIKPLGANQTEVSDEQTVLCNRRRRRDGFG